MEKEQLSRKLAVILHADVVGSTALVQKNEAIAHQRIQSAFNKFSETIDSYGGITHEIRGDALVARFERASDAVSAALKFQQLNAESNSKLKDEIHPKLRIGISLGEVIIADNTITGAGVVLAQRLEQIAAPEGVVVQGSVSETVPARMPFEFESLGEQDIKGFEQPVRAFTARLIPGKDLPDHENNTRQETEDASVSGTEQGGAAQQSVSIAVLPFTNMSNDPEQEYFSDGITEDIITELSKISALLIIARNTTFVYKNKSVDVKKVGQYLGVDYILEGSVRKSGTRVRVTAQLIDAVSGMHTWAERYDRELDDLFTLQDEIMREVVSALDIKLLAGEQSRFWSDGTTNLQAWEYFRQARYLLSLYRAEDHPEVIRLTRKALEFDPEYSAAWVLLAGCYQHIDDNSRYSQKERDEAKDLSKQCLQKGLDCDPTNSGGYSLLAMVHLTEGDFDEAVRIANKAFEMAPSHANIAALSAIVLNKCGDPETALGRIQKAIRLCPVHPTWFQMGLGQINRLLGNTDEAIKAYREMINRDPDSMEGHVGLVEMLVRSGQIDEAKAEAAEVVKINPNFSISEYTINISYRDSTQIELIKDSLRKVGFAE